MKSSLRNCCLAFVFAVSAMILQQGALAQLKEEPSDTILVVCSGMHFRLGNRNTNQRFIPLEDHMTVAQAVFASISDLEEMGMDAQLYNVEVIRGEDSIQSKVDLKQVLHDPSSLQAGDFFLKPGDVMIIRLTPSFSIRR